MTMRVKVEIATKPVNESRSYPDWSAVYEQVFDEINVSALATFLNQQTQPVKDAQQPAPSKEGER